MSIITNDPLDFLETGDLLNQGNMRDVEIQLQQNIKDIEDAFLYSHKDSGEIKYIGIMGMKPVVQNDANNSTVKTSTAIYFIKSDGIELVKIDAETVSPAVDPVTALTMWRYDLLVADDAGTLFILPGTELSVDDILNSLPNPLPTTEYIIAALRVKDSGFSIVLDEDIFSISNILSQKALGAGSSATWGGITGTLSNQTDLQAALDAKVNVAGLVHDATKIQGKCVDSTGLLNGCVLKYDDSGDGGAGAWIPASDNTGTSGAWGSITGTLTDQTDLCTALGDKENSFAKSTAFNKDFGTGSGQVSVGDHGHVAGDISGDINASFIKGKCVDTAGLLEGCVLQFSTAGNGGAGAWIPATVSGGSGEVNTASSAGSLPSGSVYACKSGTDLRFKGLIGCKGLNITCSATDVLLTPTGTQIASKCVLGTPADGCVLQFDSSCCTGLGAWVMATVSSGGATWGSIGGTLTDQTDLCTALLGKENCFTKCSAFNKNFGTLDTTVAYGNHLHSGVYEPVISPKNSAFNKNFGTLASCVACGTHVHNGIYEPVFVKCTAFNKDFGTTHITVPYGDHTHPATGGDMYCSEFAAGAGVVKDSNCLYGVAGNCYARQDASNAFIQPQAFCCAIFTCNIGPSIIFRQTNQTGGCGNWRIVGGVTGAGFEIQRGTALDYSFDTNDIHMRFLPNCNISLQPSEFCSPICVNTLTIGSPITAVTTGFYGICGKAAYWGVCGEAQINGVMGCAKVGACVGSGCNAVKGIAQCNCGVVGQAGNIAVIGTANCAGSCGVVGVGVLWDFFANGSAGTYGSFTGGHDVVHNQCCSYVLGTLVKSTGCVYKRDSSLASIAPGIEPTVTEKDSGIYGFFAGEHSLTSEHWLFNEYSISCSAVANAVGEGQALVTDIRGDIAVGDLLVSSTREGYTVVQMESDDVTKDNTIRNYTAARAMEAIDWSQEEVDESKGFKWKMIGVVYLSG